MSKLLDTGMAAVVSIMTALPASAAAIERPEDFVHRIYARYHNDGPGVPMARPGGAAFYTAQFLDAFAKDTAVPTGKGVTAEWDPICDCQAFSNLRIMSLTIGARQARKVDVRVVFSNLRFPHTVTLTLSRTPAGWRIADVGDKGGENDIESVMGLLRAGRARSERRKDPNLPQKR